jgi:hypothetical protein
MLFRDAKRAPFGLGIGMFSHELTCNVSARGAPLSPIPTAIHVFDVGQSTALSPLAIGAMDHEAPFQAQKSPPRLPPPIAMHLAVAKQDTDVR